MKNLTEGSINRHLVLMAIPMVVGMAVQVLYNLIDIYFVAKLGDAAVAGVSAASNIMFLVLALTQVLNVGAVALISRAAGAGDQAAASHAFNQSMFISALLGLLVLVLGILGAPAYMRALGADAETVELGITFLYWFVPALGLQFAMVAMGAALRGIGIVKPTMLIQVASVFINALLAPVLIAGWITGKPLGVAGAGLSSTLAVIAGLMMLAWYFARHSHYVRFSFADLVPRMTTIRRIISIGLPVGGEFFLMFVYLMVVYWVIKGFGSGAQAGFGIGMRVMQTFFMPVMALSLAMPAIIGQNLGAGHSDRIRQTFRSGLILECLLMSAVMLICKWHPDTLIGVFNNEPDVIHFGAEFLAVISWNFVGMGVIYACSGYFQGVGNTWPALCGTAIRTLLFVGSVLWLSQQPGFSTTQIWHVSVSAVIVQVIISLAWVRHSMKKYAPV